MYRIVFSQIVTNLVALTTTLVFVVANSLVSLWVLMKMLEKTDYCVGPGICWTVFAYLMGLLFFATSLITKFHWSANPVFPRNSSWCEMCRLWAFQEGIYGAVTETLVLKQGWNLLLITIIYYSYYSNSYSVWVGEGGNLYLIILYF